MCKVIMEVEKTTKNTVKFSEIKSGKLTSPAIGTLYVPKATLKAMDWQEGNQISVDLGIVAEVKTVKTAPKASAKKAAKGAAKKAPKASK